LKKFIMDIDNNTQNVAEKYQGWKEVAHTQGLVSLRIIPTEDIKRIIRIVSANTRTASEDTVVRTKSMEQ